LGEMGGGLAELKAAMEKAESAPAKPKVKKEEAPKAEEKPAAKKAEPKAEKVVAEKPAKKTAAKKDAKGDDLKVINKIGPAFEKRLNALGIHTYADLVALNDKKIEELEKQDSMTSLEQWHAWIDEAKTLNK